MRIPTLMLASLLLASCGDQGLPIVVVVGYDLVGTGAGDLTALAPMDLAAAPEDQSVAGPEDLSVEGTDIRKSPFDLTGEVINGCNGLLRCVMGCNGVNQCEQMCAAASTKMAKKLFTQLDACVLAACPGRDRDAGMPDGGGPPCARPGSKECMMCRMAAVAGPCAQQYQACLADMP